MSAAGGSPRGWRSDAGVTIVEVVVAALILAVGSLAVLGLVDGASRASFRAEQSQSVSDKLQQEVERLKAASFSGLALKAAPSSSSDTSSPANRVTGTSYYVDRAKTTSAPLVIDPSAGTIGTGGSVPQTEQFTLGDVKGTIYRYVVWRDDPTCPEAKCPGSQDAKRAIVAIKLDSTGAGGERLYQEASTDVANPNVTSSSTVDPPDGQTEFWTTHLTDTRCDQTSYQPVSTSSHPVHDTTGSCEAANGGLLDVLLKALLGDLHAAKPDLMFADAQYAGTDPATAPYINYSNNVTPNDAAQRGLTMPVPNGTASNLSCLGGTVSGLVGSSPIANITRGGLLGGIVSTTLPSTLLSPLVGSAPETRVHKWVTPKLATGLSLLNTGTGKLNLWTRSVNGASHPGRICVWIFRRALDVDGVPVDIPFVNLAQPLNLVYTTYSQPTWPTSWTKITVPLQLQLDVATLPVKSRIGVAIAVDKTGTAPGTGLQFMYDHPNYDSSLQLNISNNLPVLCVGSSLPPACN